MSNRWRVGDTYAIHVYEDNRPVATFLKPLDATQAVLDHNNRDSADRKDVERMEARIIELQDYLRNAESDAGMWKATYHRKSQEHDALADLLDKANKDVKDWEEAWKAVRDQRDKANSRLNEIIKLARPVGISWQ